MDDNVDVDRCLPSAGRGRSLLYSWILLFPHVGAVGAGGGIITRPRRRVSGSVEVMLGISSGTIAGPSVM